MPVYPLVASPRGRPHESASPHTQRYKRLHITPPRPPGGRNDDHGGLATVTAELDRKIRLTAVHAINGMIDESDAKAITAPLIGQRETARLQLAALPQQTDTPEAEVIDADEFRAAVREAWTSQPLDERRQALSRVLEKIELSPGGLEIVCRADGYHGHDPFGPPSGACPRNGGWWKCERLGRPRARAIAPSR